MVRAELEQAADKHGWPALHQQLQGLDPVAAGRINPNDAQRIQRALEVFRISGEPISRLQSGPVGETRAFESLKIVVCPDERQVLHQRIEQRFRQMIEGGFEAELRELHGRPELNSNLPAMRTVGYRQCWEWLDGRLSEEEWPEKAIVATRRLAKRQLTWLRREKQALWYDLSKEGSSDKVFGTVREFLSLHR